MDKYDTVVLPNCACLSQRSVAALSDFVRGGGRLLASFDTSLYDEWVHCQADFGLAAVLGVRFGGNYYGLGSSSYVTLRQNHPITQHFRQLLVPAPSHGVEVRTTTGQAVGFFHAPMLRQYRPLAPETTPAVVVNAFGRGLAVYIAGNIGEHYDSWGIPSHIQLVASALQWLSPPVLQIENAPETLEVVLREQAEKRYLMHLINFTGAMRRPIRNVVPCFDVRVRFLSQHRLNSVRLLSTDQALSSTAEDGALQFTIPRVDVYEVVLLE